ncbi:unnamed protein product [Acanthosepion pharaonis]|uniref:Uncharacterized protein n=1 Tax=Acanthosepion pharaonis TaxID=158019 RepID=A0A812B547_ACAPH|nr:unnamed protein product [Sepia pharaonis]
MTHIHTLSLSHAQLHSYSHVHILITLHSLSISFSSTLSASQNNSLILSQIRNLSLVNTYTDKHATTASIILIRTYTNKISLSLPIYYTLTHTTNYDLIFSPILHLSPSISLSNLYSCSHTCSHTLPLFSYAHALTRFNFLSLILPLSLAKPLTLSLFLSYRYSPSLDNTYTHVHEATVLPFLTCLYANTISLSLDHTLILTHISIYSHKLSHIYKHSLTNTYLH